MAISNSKIITGLVVFLVGAVGGNMLMKWFDEHSEANQVAQEMVKHYRPDFILPGTDNQLHSIGEWDGKVIAVNFWATWCPPCRKEIPAFVDLQEKYGAQGLQIVGIAIDEKEKVIDYMDTMGINYPVLLGEQKAIDTAKAYGDRFGALPYTAIINRRGEIVFVHRGELSQQQAESTIVSLL